MSDRKTPVVIRFTCSELALIDELRMRRGPVDRVDKRPSRAGKAKYTPRSEFIRELLAAGIDAMRSQLAIVFAITLLSGCGYDGGLVNYEPVRPYGFEVEADAYRGTTVRRPDGSTYYIRPSAFVNPAIGGDRR